jgi:dolichol-phosphate mannosyltransferase
MVVPTYNESDRLAELVEAIFFFARQRDLDLEVVIVDDNSPDGTGAIADELATRFPLKVVHREGKLGLGTAVVAGFEVASAPVVGVMDADFSHPPELVPELYGLLLDQARSGHPDDDQSGWVQDLLGVDCAKRREARG